LHLKQFIIRLHSFDVFMKNYSSVFRNIMLSILTICCLQHLSSCKKDQLKPTLIEKIETPLNGEVNKILIQPSGEMLIVGGSRYVFSEIITKPFNSVYWDYYKLDDNDGKAIYSVTNFGERVYAVSFDGKIFIKSAPTSPWYFVQTGAWEWFQDIFFTESNKGYVVSGNGYRSGRIYQTDSLGHLNKVDTFEFELCDIDFPQPHIGYACGYGAVLKTGDAGASWNLLNVRGDYFKAMHCVDANNIWAVGYNGSIIHSSDGGFSWDKQRNGNNPTLKKYRFRAVIFKDLNTGYAAGDNGLLIKTTDGGKHWSEFEHLSDSDFRCLALHPDGSLWVAGTDGAIFRILE